jgi:hypothetical protein
MGGESSGQGYFEDLMDDKGQLIVFDGNYDQYAQVINTFPQIILTKSIRVYPKETKDRVRNCN